MVLRSSWTWIQLNIPLRRWLLRAEKFVRTTSFSATQRIWSTSTERSKWLWLARMAVSAHAARWPTSQWMQQVSFGRWPKDYLMLPSRSMVSLLWVALLMRACCCIYCTSYSSSVHWFSHHWTSLMILSSWGIQGGIKNLGGTRMHQALSCASRWYCNSCVSTMSMTLRIGSNGLGLSDPIAQECWSSYLW